uniref:Uncharacterized protein n=1 Tax=Knipowitschia caucasica TaxID=637954 RepID=A0AAV2KY08_KNICA
MCPKRWRQPPMFGSRQCHLVRTQLSEERAEGGCAARQDYHGRFATEPAIAGRLDPPDSWYTSVWIRGAHGWDAAGIFYSLSWASPGSCAQGDTLRVGLEFLCLGGGCGSGSVRPPAAQGAIGVPTLLAHSIAIGYYQAYVRQVAVNGMNRSGVVDGS